MSPSRNDPDAASGAGSATEGAFGTFGHLNLSIIGLGVDYPPFSQVPEALDILAAKHYPETPAMKKVLAINQYTGIENRSTVGPVDHPLVNQKDAPSIAQLCKFFLNEAVPYAVTAARKAITEAGIDISQITHVVSTTCTNSANPGYDHYVCTALGITHPVEKVLLHGIGCSGGLASLRTAADLAMGNSFRGRPARVLVVALEISSLLVRSEMDSINELQETRIGATLFSDCASAVLLSNGIGAQTPEVPVYELLGWDHRMIPNTVDDLGFDVDPLGWKVVLTPRVPKLAAAIVAPTFADLISSLPCLPPSYASAADFDWALHPGGSTILTGVERAMNITPEHLRASYDTYIKHGNSSSATIFSVMHRLRCKDMDVLAPQRTEGCAGGGASGGPREFVVACAFGPGIAVEMAMLRRNLRHVMRGVGGEVTPPDSEEGRSDGEDVEVDADRSLEEALDGVELD